MASLEDHNEGFRVLSDLSVSTVYAFSYLPSKTTTYFKAFPWGQERKFKTNVCSFAVVGVIVWRSHRGSSCCLQLQFISNSKRSTIYTLSHREPLRYSILANCPLTFSVFFPFRSVHHLPLLHVCGKTYKRPRSNCNHNEIGMQAPLRRLL